MSEVKRRKDSLDDASREMIYNGCNLSELSKLFRMDHRNLVEKLHGVPPSGKRGKANTWRVHEVAPYLVRPIFDIEEYIKRMHPSELPKMLTKEFWAGQRSRQEYLLKAGDLWPTDQVVEVVGELFKLVKMSATLAADAVERQVEMTPRQRTIVINIMDGMLRDLRQAIIEKFEDRAPELEEVDVEAQDEAL